MQKEWQQPLLIKSYNSVYQEEYKIPIHSLWHTVKVLPQLSYVMPSCKLAIDHSNVNYQCSNTLRVYK